MKRSQPDRQEGSKKAKQNKLPFKLDIHQLKKGKQGDHFSASSGWSSESFSPSPLFSFWETPHKLDARPHRKRGDPYFKWSEDDAKSNPKVGPRRGKYYDQSPEIKIKPPGNPDSDHHWQYSGTTYQDELFDDVKFPSKSSGWSSVSSDITLSPTFKPWRPLVGTSDDSEPRFREYNFRQG